VVDSEGFLQEWARKRGWTLKKKGEKQKLFLVLNPRPGQDD